MHIKKVYTINIIGIAIVIFWWCKRVQSKANKQWRGSSNVIESNRFLFCRIAHHLCALWLKFHLARLDSTRLDSTHSTCRAHAFWLCRASRTAQLDSLVSTRSTKSNVSSWVEPSGIWAIVSHTHTPALHRASHWQPGSTLKRTSIHPDSR